MHNCLEGNNKQAAIVGITLFTNIDAFNTENTQTEEELHTCSSTDKRLRNKRIS